MKKEISEIMDKDHSGLNGEVIRYSFLVPKFVDVLTGRLDNVDFNASLANIKPNSRLSTGFPGSAGFFKIYLNVIRDEAHSKRKRLSCSISFLPTHPSGNNGSNGGQNSKQKGRKEATPLLKGKVKFRSRVYRRLSEQGSKIDRKEIMDKIRKAKSLKDLASIEKEYGLGARKQGRKPALEKAKSA